MPANNVTDTKKDEHKWEKAVEIATEHFGHKPKSDNEWAYTMGIYKNMKPDHKFDKAAKAEITPVRQRSQYTCMGTSMMMCLKTQGIECDEDEVARVMGCKPMQGASWEDALACAQHYGMRATLTAPATVRQLKAWTDKGTPVMIAWNPEGRPWSHASVVLHVEEGPPETWAEDVGEDHTIQGSGPGLYVWVADPNMPNPDKTVRVVHEDQFYSKWSEKWPNYLVRRPAMAIEREITKDGKQVVASITKVASKKLSATKVADRFLGKV